MQRNGSRRWLGDVRAPAGYHDNQERATASEIVNESRDEDNSSCLPFLYDVLRSCELQSADFVEQILHYRIVFTVSSF